MKKGIVLFLSIILVVAGVICFYLIDNDADDKINNNVTSNSVLEPKEPDPEPPLNETKDKNVIFFGDSITQGFLTRGYSWATYLKENYDFGTITNAGIMDYRLSTYDDKNKWLATQVENHYNDGINYDYVILQGGINDLFYDTPIGKISDSFDVTSFDADTLIGGLEIYLAKATTKWSQAKIGYIISYSAPKYTERGITWTEEDYQEYYDAIKKVLNKWQIPYIDFSTAEFSNLLKIQETTYLPDHLHPNKEGYDLMSPYIYEWLTTLNNYS